MGWSITKKLVLAFLAVGLIPLISAELLSIGILKEELESAIEKTMGYVVESAEAETFSYFDSVASRTVGFTSDGLIRDELAAIEGGNNYSAAALNNHLSRNKLPLVPSLAGIMLIGRDGTVVSASDPKEIGKNASAAAFFRNGSQGAFMSGIGNTGFFGVSNGFVVSAPVTDRLSNEPLGVLANFFDTRELERRLSSVHTEDYEEIVSVRDVEGQKVYLVDSGGTVVIPAGGGTAYSEPVRACLEEKEDFVGEYTNHLGQGVIGAGGCFPSRGLVVVAEIDAAGASRPIERSYVLLGYVTLFFATFVILVGLILSSSISRPVKELTAAIERISRGGMDAEVPVWLKQSGDELGSLAQAFDRTIVSLKMAIRQSAPELVKDKERLRSTLEETEAATETLSAIFDNARDGLVLIDDKGMIVRANKAVEMLWGFSPREIEGKMLDELDMLGQETRKRLLDAFSRRMKGENVPPYEVEVIRKDGVVAYAEVRASAIIKDGTLKGEVVLLRDLTDAPTMRKAGSVAASPDSKKGHKGGGRRKR
ncbi:MAG: PAS domain S-box protein [Candidatus Micrarchaeota archaeon]